MTTPTAPTIAETGFRETLAYVRPKPDELRWQEIPWQTELRAACRIAAAERKPILLWAMNGNPLGCT
ncbi:MAG: hypothetical protein ACRDJH_20375 [Thermomicrobiales bacterium]